MNAGGKKKNRRKRSFSDWSDEEEAVSIFECVEERRTARRCRRDWDDTMTEESRRQKTREERRGREKEESVESGLAPLRSFFSLAQRLTGIFCRPNEED